MGAVGAGAGAFADAAPEALATGTCELQMGAVGAGAGVVADVAPEGPATGIGEMQHGAVSADAGVFADAAPEAPATGRGVLQLGAVRADAGVVADAAPEAPATGIGVLQLGAVSAGGRVLPLGGADCHRGARSATGGPNIVPWCKLFLVMVLAKGAVGAKGRSVLVNLMQGLRAGGPLATLTLIGVMFIFP